MLKVDTEEQKERKKWVTEKEKTFSAWGYKFEQYMSVQVHFYMYIIVHKISHGQDSTTELVYWSALITSSDE